MSTECRYMGMIHCVTGWRYVVECDGHRYMFLMKSDAHKFVARMNQALNA